MSRPRLPAPLITVAALAAGAGAYAQPEAAPPPPAESAPPPPEPPLDERAALARGKALYDAGKYAECAQIFNRLLGPKGRLRVEKRHAGEKARLYYAACLIGIGQPKRADEVFREAIRESPQIRPNPLEFPGPVVQRFNAVRETMLAEIKRADQERARRAKREAEKAERAAARERARQKKLLRLAEQETIITENSRWVAAVPFGVGQFQNDSPTLGWLFLTTELAALGTTIGGLVYELELHSQEGDPDIDRQDWNVQITNARRLWTISLWSLAGLAVVGIMEAQLSYQPQFRRTRRRQLPEDVLPDKPAKTEGSAVSVLPLATLQPSGFGLGLVARF